MAMHKEIFGSPFPSSVERKTEIAGLLANFSVAEKTGENTAIVGRIIAIRDQGSMVFLDITDASGKIQVVLNSEKTDRFSDIKNVLDLGDFVQAEGVPFLTKRGEKSVAASQLRLISKCLRPWPSQWYGVSDIETRERQRYLDLVFNENSKENLLFRSRLVASLREILARDGFLEVETPILQMLPGGALAKPFSTHFNALDLEVYLRVAPELYLKRLLVGGFEKIFEIAKNFRNEGVDRDHYPEFTMLELYWAYKDYQNIMEAVEVWLKELVRKMGLETIEINNSPLKKFFDKWPRLEYAELIKKYSGKNLADLKAEEIDEVFKKEVRPKIIEPVFVINYPKSISPLAKSKEDNPEITERFQMVVGATELVNGFSELNDPIDQRARMEEQEKMLHDGNEDVTRLDEDFLEALEYGMPPSAGIGIGIDRLAALLKGARSIREVISFTNLRPK